MIYRSGIGLDQHAIESKDKNSSVKKKLILGGVEISKDYYFVADSDGDVIIHSLCNALSTAIGGGSLDTWAGPMFKKGITNSQKFLGAVLNKVRDKGFKINNISIMVEGKRPRLEKYRSKIQDSLAKILNIKKHNIGIAFASGQNLTVFGEGKGLQVFSLVLLKK